MVLRSKFLFRVRKRGQLGLILWGLFLGVSGCRTIPTVAERGLVAQRLSEQTGFKPLKLSSRPFELLSFIQTKRTQSPLLTVYLEGDGHAFKSIDQASEDPTPIQPTALKLAINQPYGVAGALFRPCQYIGVGTNPKCTKEIWTDHRFDREVLASINEGLSILKAKVGAERIRLVGFSGGAAVALLVASIRPDVEGIVAVAGNVDPNTWTHYHALTPLSGSLDTVTTIGPTSKIPQVYFMGTEDSVVPPQIAEDFASRFPEGFRPVVIHVDGVTHSDGWDRLWSSLYVEADNLIRGRAKTPPPHLEKGTRHEK